jgi:hypothetical protein
MGFHVRGGILRRPKLAPASFLKGFFAPPTHIRCSVLCVDGRDTSSCLASLCRPPLASDTAQAATADDEMLKKRSSRRRSARRATGQEEALEEEEGLISGAGTVWWSEWFVLLGQCADEEERWVRRRVDRRGARIEERWWS